ncbi:MAG: enoyl-CoA hydratase-related protein [Promethearchaeota archaeon]
MEFETILFEKDGGVATITLNRPRRKNAMNGRMFEELPVAFKAVEVDPEVRVAVVTGAGDSFSSGGDFSMDYGEAKEGQEPDVSQKALVLQLASIPKPIIAAVNGLALGAGLSLALNCDLVYASEDAELGMFFVKRAITPEMSTTYLLPRLVGVHRAKELIFFGDRIGAREAAAIGLINAAFPAETFMAEVLARARRLAAGPMLAIGLAKTLIHDLLRDKVAQALDAEADALFRCFETQDFLESVLAFMDKREPKFTGS